MHNHPTFSIPLKMMILIPSTNPSLKTGIATTPRLSHDFSIPQFHPSIRSFYPIWDCQTDLELFGRGYSSIDSANKYQLGLDLRHLCFELGQTLTDFYSKMSNLWNHLAQFEPNWTCSIDAAFIPIETTLVFATFSWLFLLIMSVRKLLFFIAIFFLSWPSSCRAQTKETRKKTMIYHQYSSWFPAYHIEFEKILEYLYHIFCI